MRKRTRCLRAACLGLLVLGLFVAGTAGEAFGQATSITSTGLRATEDGGGISAEWMPLASGFLSQQLELL